MVPHDGFGLDPSLQNPYMAAHPPALYLGYVSFAVPFAFAMAALITRRTDARWLASVRRWTLFAWASLGVGMLLGAHWAYVEIGWGGYWGWDPVENAALMPWLAGTAYLHSVMVQEKRGMLKVWNVVLVTATFALSIFGTFLTRSGVVDSIHSFVQSPVGPALLVFLSIVLAFATTLLGVAAAAAPQRPQAGVGGVARGDVPVQQPAAAGVRVRDPVGRGVPAAVRGGAGRAQHGVGAVLQLLPGRVRPAAAGADRYRSR